MFRVAPTHASSRQELRLGRLPAGAQDWGLGEGSPWGAFLVPPECPGLLTVLGSRRNASRKSNSGLMSRADPPGGGYSVEGGGDTLKPGFNRIKKSLILMRRYKIELQVTGKLQKERKKKKKDG